MAAEPGQSPLRPIFLCSPSRSRCQESCDLIKYRDRILSQIVANAQSDMTRDLLQKFSSIPLLSFRYCHEPGMQSLCISMDCIGVLTKSQIPPIPAIHGTSPAAAHARPAAAGRQRNFVRGGRWAGATHGSRRRVGDGRRWAAAAIGGDR